MIRIRYRSGSALVVGASPAEIVSYQGAEGELADVPDDIAELLEASGIADRVPAEKPAPGAKRARKARG